MSNHSFPTAEAERNELIFNYQTTHVTDPFDMDLYVFNFEEGGISGAITKGKHIPFWFLSCRFIYKI